MPRFFFHVHDGAVIRDEEGAELSDLQAARTEAVKYAGRLLIDEADKFWSGEEWRMEVTDEAGLILFVLMFVATNSPAVS